MNWLNNAVKWFRAF